MRRKKSLVAFAMLMVTVMLIAAGCGCQQESKENDQKSSKTETNSFSTKTETGTQEATSQKKASTDFTPSKSLEERKAVNYEDYLKDGTFDLTAYAEALGYTRLENPESKGTIMYAIKIDKVKCFIAFMNSTTYLYIDRGDEYTYRAAPVNAFTNPADVTVVSKGQENQDTSWKGLECLTTPMDYIATVESVSIDHLPGFTLITKYEGASQYYSNGMIKYKELGKDIETIECH